MPVGNFLSATVIFSPSLPYNGGERKTMHRKEDNIMALVSTKEQAGALYAADYDESDELTEESESKKLLKPYGYHYLLPVPFDL